MNLPVGRRVQVACATLLALVMSSRCTILALAAGLLTVGIQAQSIGELSASDASVKGAVVMTAGDTRVISGSNISAGGATASLHLARGGEVRLCPRSSLSVTASQNGRELMLALGTGAIEAHYGLSSSADTILTPDFRILLAGPGEFHLAIASDARGNTCVRGLPSNTGSVIVNELLGEGVYQVRPGEQVLFRGGTVKDPSSLVPPDCGCPAVAPPLRAERPAAPVSSPQVPPEPAAPQAQPGSPALVPGPPSTVAAPPPVSADEVHVSVDAPFVFHADDPPVPPAPLIARVTLQKLPPLLFSDSAVAPQPEVVATKPAPPATPPKKGFFGHVRSFFAAMFR